MKILLVDDHALFRGGLKLMLSALNHDATIFEAATVDESLTIAQANPDLRLCLLDLNLRNESGLRALARLKEAAPEVAVVVVSADEQGTVVRQCIDAGAMSYITKSAPPDVLSEALIHVLRGQVYLPSHMLESENDNGSIPTFSPRQRDVLRGLCRGLSTKSIARELSISEHTTKEYIGTLFRLLNVHSRTEAVIMAGRLRLDLGNT
ncbi:MAG: response regulator transcription factor [Gammaproteobacteria bacterium]